MWFGARALLSGASRVHYTADEEQRRAETALPWLGSGVVIPLGVDDSLFATAPADESRWQGPVVVLARLDPKKGIDIVIRAFQQVAPRFPTRKLMVAGDGETSYVRELRALAADGPAAGRIEFTGWLDGAERARVLGGASVFVLPSAQENFGLSIVEAMALGTPVLVARTVDLAARIADERAGWVVNRSVESVAGALSESLSNPDDCRARGSRARRLAENYRWRNVANQLKALYGEVAGEDAPRAHTGHRSLQANMKT